MAASYQVPYTGEIVTDPHGQPSHVIDVDRIDFNDPAALWGLKTDRTFVRVASGQETIQTVVDGCTEMKAFDIKPGDLIFGNYTNDDAVDLSHDVYAPTHPDGRGWTLADLPKFGYQIVGEDNVNGGLQAIDTVPHRLFRESVQMNSCIPDRSGNGRHQFLYPGATLREKTMGGVVGVHKHAFDTTWTIVPNAAPTAATNPATQKLGAP